MSLSVEDIKRNLQREPDHSPSRDSSPYPYHEQEPDLIERAAVLIPLYRENDAWHLIFIKRTEHDQDDHSGQIAFPGGRVEDGDKTVVDTALRETKEEIGLHPRDVNILGFSDDIFTVTDYHVTPIAGTFPWPYPLKPYPLEVEKILSYPLNWLADPDHHRVEHWSSDESDIGPLPVYFFQDYEGETLWGATAKIVLDFLNLLKLTP